MPRPARQLAVQVMLMRLHAGRAEAFARLLEEIRTDEVQLNAPLRPVPRAWFPEAHGKNESVPFPAARVRTMNPEEAARFKSQLRQLTRLKVVSVFSRRN